MNKLELLAQEATDLYRHDAQCGHIRISAETTGWSIVVFVHNPFAFHHCDERFEADDRMAEFWVMRGTGKNLDEIVDRMLTRVQDAVADTPAELVA